MYHLFQFIVKAGTSFFFFFYNSKAEEITCFFNSISKRYVNQDLRPVQAGFLRHKMSSDWKLIQVLAISIGISIFAFFFVLLPLVSMSFPKLHEALFIKIIFHSYDSHVFKVCVWTVQIICHIPTSIFSPISITSSFATLGEITLALRNLW